MDLNRAQFQPALPGLDALKPQPRGNLAVLRDLTHREFVDDKAHTYRGPIPGQQVMGVHHLGGDAINHISRGSHQEPFYTVDPTGMVQETGDSGRRQPAGARWVSPADIEAKQNVAKTMNLYPRYGGVQKDDPETQKHWAAQPLQHIDTMHAVHTGQDWRETEWGADADRIMAGARRQDNAAGRQRINAVRATLQQGEDIREPAWIVKRSGRLYSMDGHHRIVASREEGRETFPARVWDLDADEAKRARRKPVGKYKPNAEWDAATAKVEAQR